MKQDLIDLITSGYELDNQLVGDEVVNYNKLNKISYQLVRNLVGEFTESKSLNGDITADSRLDDNYTEKQLALNEIFNNYRTATNGGHSIKGGQGNHSEGNHNKIWGTYSSIYNHTEGANNNLVTGGHFLYGKNYVNDVEVIADGHSTDSVEGKSNHLEGTSNYILFANYSHSEGQFTAAIKNDAGHSEGYHTLAYGRGSHAEGVGNGTPIISALSILSSSDDYGTCVNTIRTGINEVLSNKASYNNPGKNGVTPPNIYTLLASKADNLNNAIANQFIKYSSRTSYIAFDPYSKSYFPNTAFGEASHTEGCGNAAFESSTHSEGRYSTAVNLYSHAEGDENHTFGKGSHAEGGHNIAGPFAILNNEGKDITRSFSDSAISSILYNAPFTLFSSFNSDQSDGTKLVIDKFSFTELNLYYTEKSIAGVPFYGLVPWGSSDLDESGYQHAEGYRNLAFGNLTHAEGYQNWAISDLVHIEGYSNLATYGASKFSGTPEDIYGAGVTRNKSTLGIHIEGASNTVFGYGTMHIEGSSNIVADAAFPDGLHVEGYHNKAVLAGPGVHLEGYGNFSNYNTNKGAHIEGVEFEYGADYKREYNSSTSSYIAQYYGYYTYNDMYNSAPSPSIKYGPTNDTGNSYTITKTIESSNYNITVNRLGNTATKAGAHAEGSGTAAMGIAAHAEGSSYQYERPYLYGSSSPSKYFNYYFSGTKANASHIEGAGTCIYDDSSGRSNVGAHAEGILTYINSSSAGSHAEGYNTQISYALAGHAEGVSSRVSSSAGHAEGVASVASGVGAHAEGIALAINTGAQDSYGNYTVTDYTQPRFALTQSISFWNLNDLIIYNDYNDVSKTLQTLYTENISAYNYDSEKDCPSYNYNGVVQATSPGAHAEGAGTSSAGTASHTEGVVTKAFTTGAHAEGVLTYCAGVGAHSEGIGSMAVGTAAHAEGIGLYQKGATGVASHIEGMHCIGNADAAHAEGKQCDVSGGYAGHAEGYLSRCYAPYGHAEGTNTLVTSAGGHAGGDSSNVHCTGGFAHGNHLQVSATSYQAAFGQFNDYSTGILDPSKTIFMLGNGSAANDRSNALEVDNEGNLAIGGDIIFAGGISLTEILDEIGSGGGGTSGGASYSSADMSTY